MSEPKYIVSGDVYRELDHLMNLMETEILDGDINTDSESMKTYYRYQGLKECVCYMKSLTLNLPEQTHDMQATYKYAPYQGKEYQIDIEEEED